MVPVRLMLFDRQTNLVDERIDLALRIGELADSSMVAPGSVKCAAPWLQRQAISRVIRPLKNCRISPGTR
jgi:hypothetical protein